MVASLAMALVLLLGGLGGGVHLLVCHLAGAETSHACCAKSAAAEKADYRAPAAPACEPSCPCCSAHEAEGIPGPWALGAGDVPPAPLLALLAPRDVAVVSHEPHEQGATANRARALRFIPRGSYARLMVFLI